MRKRSSAMTGIMEYKRFLWKYISSIISSCSGFLNVNNFVKRGFLFEI